MVICCPACNADMPVLLGILGNLAHFRCRYCGTDYSMPSELIEEDNDTED